MGIWGSFSMSKVAWLWNWPLTSIQCKAEQDSVKARQGYHQNIPCGATATLGSSCKMGVPGEEARSPAWASLLMYHLPSQENTKSNCKQHFTTNKKKYKKAK